MLSPIPGCILWPGCQRPLVLVAGAVQPAAGKAGNGTLAKPEPATSSSSGAGKMTADLLALVVWSGTALSTVAGTLRLVDISRSCSHTLDHKPPHVTGGPNSHVPHEVRTLECNSSVSASWYHGVQPNAHTLLLCCGTKENTSWAQDCRVHGR